MADPHFASVVLLAANDNQPDGTTTFVDQSTAARTITSVGGAQYDTTALFPGMSSSYLGDGTGDGLRCAASVDFRFATEWTVEFYVAPHVLNATQDLLFLSTSDSVGIRLTNTGVLQVFWLGNLLTSGASGMSIDTPYHVAVSRDAGNDIRVFINGTQLGLTVNNANNPAGNTGCNIAVSFLDANSLNGWLASARVTKGVCRYDADFTPPSLPLPTSAVDAPVAAFTGSPLSGNAPLDVQFTDLSTNTPTGWAWTFGDGDVSTLQNPQHTYTGAGTYTVGLTASNAGGSDLDTKTDYITVTTPAVTPAGGHFSPPDDSKRRAEERRRQESRREAIGRLFQNAQDLPPAEREEVVAIEKRFTPPEVIGVDFRALFEQAELVKRLIALERTREDAVTQRRRDDEDDEDAIMAALQ